MKEYRLGPPNGEMITNTDNNISSVFAATTKTYFSGIAEVGGAATASGPIAFLNPIVLRPEDICNTPSVLEIDAFGFAENFNASTNTQIGFVVVGETDITKEFPNFINSAGTKFYPNTNASRQSAASTYLLNHSGGFGTNGVSGQRLGFHYHVKVCFLSAKASTNAYTTVVCKQITVGECTYNTSTGIYDTSSAGSNNDYTPDVADNGTTIFGATGTKCLAISRLDHTAGLKVALGVVKANGSVNANSRIVLCAAVARLYPDSSSSNSTVFDNV